MISIVKGNVSDLKSEMLAYKKASGAAASKMRKKYRKQILERKVIPQDARRILEADELVQRRYNTTRTLPVYVGDMVIDMKTAQDFLKKLKGFEVKLHFIEGGIQIDYWKMGRRSKGSGHLKLYDLKRFYKDLQHIPIGKIEGLIE